MSCAHLEAIAAGFDTAFTVDASRVTFGSGALGEVGERARALGMRRAALFTDRQMRGLPWFEEIAASLARAGIDVAVFDAVAIEPTDGSFEEAARFAVEARVDGYVSVGGGSVIDTCKVADLLASHPAPLRTYASSPVGDARPVPGPLAPHIACPTTSGTGSEVTGIAVCEWRALHAKSGISSPRLRPTEALVDPRCASTLPAGVVAASGMDVLCHAVESYTARSYLQRAAPPSPVARPMSQGANPWSDLGCREALRLIGTYLERAVRDAGDAEARDQMMWAATLAGIAFGNAGVHAPHAMAYAVAGRVHSSTSGAAARSGPGEFRSAGYPDAPLVPHGMAVALNAPAVFRFTGPTAPSRHLEAAALLGGETRGAGDGDAGEVLAAATVRIMRAIGIPNGIAGVGYDRADIEPLVEGTLPQQRLLVNAPCDLPRDVLAALFERALRYW